MRRVPICSRPRPPSASIDPGPTPTPQSPNGAPGTRRCRSWRRSRRATTSSPRRESVRCEPGDIVDAAAFARIVSRLLRPGGLLIQDVQLSTLPFVPADRWWESIYLAATVRGMFPSRAPTVRFLSNKRGYSATFGRDLLDAGFDPRDVMDKSALRDTVVPAVDRTLRSRVPADARGTRFRPAPSGAGRSAPRTTTGARSSSAGSGDLGRRRPASRLAGDIVADRSRHVQDADRRKRRPGRSSSPTRSAAGRAAGRSTSVNAIGPAGRRTCRAHEPRGPARAHAARPSRQISATRSSTIRPRLSPERHACASGPRSRSRAPPPTFGDPLRPTEGPAIAERARARR